MTNQLTMTPTLPGVELPSGGSALNNADVTKDYAGNRFDSYLLTEGNTTVIHIIKRGPEGEVLDEAIASPASGPAGARKLNSARIKISGSDVLVVGIGYDYESAPMRTNYPMSAIWGGAAVPYPDGMDPEKGGGAPVFPQEPVPTEQIFADVLPDSPFYEGVQALAAAGAIGGYPCGGPNEPCDALQRPYFRPNNTLTRGQACKIINKAVGGGG